MKRTLPLLLCLLTLLLAACGDPSTGGNNPPPTDDGSPTFTRDEFDATVGGTSADVSAVATTAAQDPALTALASVFDPGMMAAYGDGGLAVSAFVHGGTGSLPHGVYVYNESDPYNPWTYEGPSDDLIYRWSFTDATGASSSAELTIDWDASAPTMMVDDGHGATVEVPTGARATLVIEGETAATIDLTAAWYDCDGTRVADPTLISVDGSIGGVVDIDEVGFEVTDSRADSSGGVTLGTASEYVAVTWNVTANGAPVRESCYLVDFDVDSGRVDFGVETLVDGESGSFEFGMGFSNIGTDETSGTVTSVDLSDGAIRIDGRTAVTFDGTLDDEDGDDVPGENVTVRFADGTSATLEELIEGVAPTATALKAAAALLR